MTTVTCSYCGISIPVETISSESQVLSDHINVCEKLKSMSAEITISKLRSALVDLVGVDGKKELEEMESHIRKMDIPIKDKTAAINSIRALLDTINN